MKNHSKLILVISMIVIMLGASAVKTALSAGGNQETRPTNSGDEGTPIESSGGVLIDAPVMNTDESTTEIVPDLEARTRSLDGVNLSPDFSTNETTSAIVEPPMPGTETGTGEVIVPLPAPSVNNVSPAADSSFDKNIIVSSVRSVGDWLLAFVKSLLNG